MARTFSFQPLTLQAACFGLVGALNTALDLSVYFALTQWGGLSAAPLLAKALAYSAGVGNSFLCHRAWTFHSRHAPRRSLRATLPLFALTNLIGLSVNAGVLHMSLNLLGLPELAALVLATGASLAWNFGASKYVVFRA